MIEAAIVQHEGKTHLGHRDLVSEVLTQLSTFKPDRKLSSKKLRCISRVRKERDKEKEDLRVITSRLFLIKVLLQ